MSDTMSLRFIQSIADELAIHPNSVAAAIQLLKEGNTIPFIARYRKEATGNLDELQIKNIQERHHYLKELEERKLVILCSIESQGKLTDGLREQIIACQLKTSLEDLYLPYKPKRRTRAMIAREKGLESLAELILQQPLNEHPEEAAQAYVSVEKGVEDIAAALAGARDIAAEKIAENALIRAFVRETFAAEGIVISKVRAEKALQSTKFDQYYDFKEAVKTIPSHRYLAIRRGEREEILDLSIKIEAEPVLIHIEKILKLNSQSPFGEQLRQAIEDAFHRLIYPSVETDIRLDLKVASDRAAIAIFADNLRNLLLAPPMGGRLVIAIDPGVRTGCKCAVVDAIGKYLDSATIYLSQGEQALQQAKKELRRLIEHYQPYAIAIGNGTAGRETEAFVRQFLKEIAYLSVIVVPVNEAGASVYSASDVAREEFPDLDITIRGAVSIARRLQDPLAELVKIDPKSIGVGQYQHDVHQPLLQDELQHVVESCVNKVGVDLNTASYSLLTYVSGIGSTLARKIIKHRENYGAFKSRSQLREISGFGPKTFEQAAGFLRIRDGENPLDASAVHPERYGVVEQIAQDLHVSLSKLVCNPKLIDSIDFSRYACIVGEHTLTDMIQELKKPGRDPRASFEPPSFRDDILSIEDLKPGMRLEGVVTNVTAFGAFVDIGVHQDGLIHLSEISNQYVKDPREVVKTGDKIQVEVLQIDIPRRRISLTARLGQKRETHHSSQSATEKFSKTKTKQAKSNFYSNPFANL
jgi:uncharacterized protein